jgi:phytanoyl-CoA hydroxylase
VPTTFTFEHPAADHDPKLYAASETVRGVLGFDAVDEDALARYERDGFLVVHGACSRAQVAAALDELRSMSEAIDPACSVVAYEGSFRSRIERELSRQIEGAPEAEVAAAMERIPAAERAPQVRKLMGFTRSHPPLKEMADHRPLRALLRRIIGGDTRLFQAMALVKPPGGREKPWHQDHAYFDFPLDTRIAGVWIALERVTPENGCMFVLPGEHRLGPRIHFKRRDWQICDTEIFGRREAALPMEPGDLMIFDAKLPHGTPTNRTSVQRWALQYHYVPAAAVKTATEERLAVFGAEGKDVTC